MPKKQSTKARSARVAAREGEKFTKALRRLSSAPDVHTDGRHDRVELEFTGEIFQWRGPAPYYFVSVPEEQSRALKAASSGLSHRRGTIPVQTRIGDTEWTTSLWPKDGHYVVPLKDRVRKPMELADGDTVTIHLAADIPTVANKRDNAAARSDRKDRKARPRKGSGQAGVVAARRRPQLTDDRLRIVPANEATWEDLQTIFGVRGDSSRCWCQRYKMRPKEAWGSVGATGLAARLREQTACGQPESAVTTGLVAYLDDEPVGWCAVDPRPANPRLLSHCRVPWADRGEDKTDERVWAVTCFVTRVGFRRRGISRALARAAVDFARQRGARALEGYPDTTAFDHVGTPGVFAAAGFVEVSRPTTRRIVMRIDLAQHQEKQADEVPDA
jgi:GNAT superfamily N-acetyltransferase